MDPKMLRLRREITDALKREAHRRFGRRTYRGLTPLERMFLTDLAYQAKLGRADDSEPR